MEIEQVAETSLTLIEQANSIIVCDATSYSFAGNFIAGCKELIAEIEAAHEKAIQSAHKAHKEAIALRDRDLEPVETAMQQVASVALMWKTEQDRLAKAEQERQYQERTKAEQERQLKEAEILEKFGDTEGAQRALDMAVIPARPTKFESPAPKIDGLATRKTWKARIVNPHQVNRQFCLPDQTLCNRAVQSFMQFNRNPTAEQIKALEAEIGGVEIYQEETFASAPRSPAAAQEKRRAGRDYRRDCRGGK